MNEDQTLLLAAADFGFSDPSDSPADAFSRVKISTLPVDGALELDGVAVTAGDFITLSDINLNKLTFTRAGNEHADGGRYAGFTFQVEDDGGTNFGGVNLDQTANTITIDVAEVDDPPQVSGVTLAPNPAPEGTAVGLTATFTDGDGDSSDSWTAVIAWGDGTI